MDEEKIKNIIRDEVGGPLNNISNILDDHFNPPKKVNLKGVITYVIIGAFGVWGLYMLYNILQPIFNYKITM